MLSSKCLWSAGVLLGVKASTGEVVAGAKAPRYFLSNLSESVFIETRDARDKVSMLQYQLSNKRASFCHSSTLKQRTIASQT